MGKYMRKCRGAAGEEVTAVEVTQVVGVRTRSRSAAVAGGGVAKVAPRRKKALAPPNVTAVDPAAVGAGGDGGSCYIHLRSRMLFMAPPQQPSAPRAPTPAEAAVPFQGVAGLSRCSSTASSMDVGAHQDRSHACRSSDAAEVGGDHVPEVSASNSGSGPDRERRETTPSSRAHGEVSDLESDLAGQNQKSSRPLPAATSAGRLVMPPAAEIEAFFKAAEEARAKSFAAKYNFDVVRGVPLDGGRFEWTPVVSI